MRRNFTAAVAAAAMAIATVSISTPAFANPNGATFADYNGPDLTTAIHASGSNNTNDAFTVYGSTTWPVGQDTPFTGFSSVSVNGSGVLTGTNTNIHITGGSGFAAISDADFNSQVLSTQNLFGVIMDPPAFTDYEFSVQLAGDGAISLYVMLTGSSIWELVTGSPIDQKANQNNQYLLSGLTSGSFDKVLISSTAPIFEVKQNSINLLGAPRGVPEPATWAMMLLGFGGIGMTMRRKQRRNGVLMQVA